MGFENNLTFEATKKRCSFSPRNFTKKKKLKAISDSQTIYMLIADDSDSYKFVSHINLTIIFVDR